MHRCPVRAALAVALAVGAVACSGGVAPVGEVAVEPRWLDLPYPGTADLQITLRLPGLEPDAAAGRGAPILFVHLLDGTGEVVRTFDHPLPAARRVKEELTYSVRLYQSALGAPLPGGTYPLTVGVYQPGGERWPLSTAGEEVGRMEYAVATVKVPPAASEAPRFELSSAWQPLESGTDRQVLGRRWLAGEGTIHLVGTPAPGFVWLVIRVPPTDLPGVQLVLEEGATTAAVTISSSCDDMKVSLTGPGVHAVEMPVPAGEGCQVWLRPTFYLVMESSFERRSLALETLTWTASER